MNFIQSLVDWYQSLTLLEFFFIGGVCGTIVVIIGCIALVLGVLLYRKARKIAPLNHTVDALNAKIAELTQERNKMLDELAQAKQTLAEAKLAKDWLNENKDKVTELQRVLANLQADLGKEKERVANKQKELTDLNSRVDDKAQKEAELNAKLSGEQAALDVAQKARDSAQAMKQQLEAKLGSLNKEIGEKTHELNTLDGTVAKLQDAKAELESVRKELEKLKGEAAAAHLEISTRDALRGVDANYWQNLDTPILPLEKIGKRSETNSAEQDWLHAFRQMLSDTGFHFSERTLNAFHTGLKCGNETPLVVLAGISGTGKSLLPELYAAWAGFNFLSVPVQPRWDGPQDLLGFHNGLEGRYKATELARFLWQADWHHNREGKHCFGKDALNLILLDEMNLARVEYYFSDFLSKLEQRRNIDEANETQISNASIWLEAGTHTTQHRQLFLGPNTFIVGTMNEDETTQMLSDKVVDRSNVLRFGRPASLTMSTLPSKQAFLQKCDTHISRDHWNGWCKKDVSTARYMEKLDKLNEAFTAVGRPFGHRVAQAVNAYLQNYPTANLDNAFADQIEMKVLPKLNGLDLSMSNFVTMVQSQVQSIIEELKDDALSDTFLRSCNPENAFFRWRGVMR